MFEMKPRPPKNFQEEVVDSILAGDLAALKKCCIGKNDINRHLLPHKELRPNPRYNRDQRYLNLKGPTILMFAILCEQDEIVEYLLDAKNPNVSIKVEGYNCLHLASMIKDPRCLKLLLQHKWIQENIDEPVDFPGANAKEDEKTTALHVAVSNRRYANAILLLDHLPKPRWKHSLNKTPNLEQLNEKENLEEEETIERHPAFINQKSAAGLVPLYIAVFLNDYKMVRILLFFKADPTILCSKDITPIHLAEGIKKKNDEKKTKLQSQQISQEKKEKGSKLEIDQIDQIDLIVEALHNQEKEENKDTLDILKKEIAPELLDNNGEYSSDSDEEENNDDDNESVVLSPSEVAEIKGLLKRIHKIISKK